eukprot:585539-Amphidinium_carterae.1
MQESANAAQVRKKNTCGTNLIILAKVSKCQNKMSDRQNAHQTAGRRSGLLEPRSHKLLRG